MAMTALGVALVKLLPAERAHKATIKSLKLGLGVPLSTPIDPDSLHVTLPVSGLQLPNPVGLAAGFDKNAEVFGPMFKFGFGMVECGTVTPKPQAGNPQPRLFRLTEDRAVINRMGFNNEGLAAYVRRLQKAGARTGALGANVGANKISEGQDRIKDYALGLSAVWPHCDYVTINISSPNTPGLRGLQNKDELNDLLKLCRLTADTQEGERPVFLKVAPDLDSEAIADIISVVKGMTGFLTGLIISNTTIARPDSLQSKHAGEGGGLSGAPLMDASTQVLAEFARGLNGAFDLIGAGGIASGADAYAKIKAGAHAIQLYSALVYEGPGLAKKIKTDLLELMAEDGFSNISEAVGAGL
ncbi:MAG: quinone-dependent dihydroorotate dehydrogenase [Hyphomonadaceae bacterium]